MTTVSIFILFVLYTLACIADGPDIKPILKRKVSNYLRDKADNLYMANYCYPQHCVFPKKCIELSQRLEAERNPYQTYHNLDMLKESIKVDEYQRMQYINRYGNEDMLINEMKYRIIRRFADTISTRIMFRVDKDNPDHSIYIHGILVVGK